ncbi:MAG: sulfurtransferase TusA family protein [Candidatus Calescibacterium sp.]|jgi:TusA-related sulfurtransferase|nr:sulfurtransferase TusA family protein [Candidatus Calescibacterium sp.]
METPENIPITKELDLRGTICPMNIIIAKKEITKMKKGEILKIIVDFPGAKDDVSKSLQKEGHKILNIKEYQTHAEIIVQV